MSAGGAQRARFCDLPRHQVTYVRSRLERSISVIDFESRQVTGTWRIGGSPDLMQLNPDGHWLWVSGRLAGIHR